MKVKLSLPYHGTSAPGTVIPLRADAPLLHEGRRIGDLLAAVVGPDGDELIVDAEVTDSEAALDLTMKD